jgi:benzoylformate decarboxylase
MGRPAMVNLHTALGLGMRRVSCATPRQQDPTDRYGRNQRRSMQNQYCLLTNTEPTTVPKPFVNA